MTLVDSHAPVGEHGQFEAGGISHAERSALPPLPFRVLDWLDAGDLPEVTDTSKDFLFRAGLPE
jgi:hypothetical protein